MCNTQYVEVAEINYHNFICARRHVIIYNIKYYNNSYFLQISVRRLCVSIKNADRITVEKKNANIILPTNKRLRQSTRNFIYYIDISMSNVR